MASFGVYLASISVPIAKRVLSGLGVGVVSYVGLDFVLSQVRDNVISQWGAMPPAVIQLLSIYGVNQAIGIILGAFAARYTMLQLSALGRVQ